MSDTMTMTTPAERFATAAQGAPAEQAPSAAAPVSGTPARIQVFWMPGCSSCLRTKDFLRRQGIEFESVDVMNDPGGMDKLTALGARSVPVVALGGRYTLCQSFGDVIKFLDLKTKTDDPLPNDELARRLDRVLTVAEIMARQIPEDRVIALFGQGTRTPGGTAFHVFRIAEMGLEAAEGKLLQFESFLEVAPDDWSPARIADFGRSVRERVSAWWAKQDPALDFEVPTYYGKRSMSDVFERTTWHSAQHTRQLANMLETFGITPKDQLTKADLAGLPVPDTVWG